MRVLVRLSLVCISLIVISLMFVSASYPDIDPSAVAAVWLFDEGSGKIAADSSGNGHDGMLENDPQWVDGQFSKALEFNGTDDCISLPPGILENPDSWSITLWARIDSAGTWPALIQLNFGTTSGFATGIVMGENVVRSLYDDQCKVQGEPIVTGEWRHIAVTSSGNTDFKIYEDGVDVSAPSGGGGWFIDTDIIAFGYNSEYFKGVLDEVAVFDVALEEEDVQDIMEQGLYQILRLAVEPLDKLVTTWASIRVQY